MKALFNSCIIALLLNIAILCYAQQPANIPQSTPYKLISRNANSQIWERTVYEPGPSGQTIARKHHYTELATGLNFKDPATGQWVASKEEINILPDGTAAAVYGQHKAYFPGDIYNGVIRLVTLDGLQLQSRPLGLSYDDGTNTVLIAELTNSVGRLISSNQVIYANAFVGVNADLLYTYRKGGFEQDVIFRQQPPTPEEFGMDSATCRLQVLTEFFNPPAPAKTTGPANQQTGLQDTTLTFGGMKMIPGKAFSIANSHSQSIPVCKTWVTVSERNLLIEQVPYRHITSQLATLPPLSSSTLSSIKPKQFQLASKRLLPPKHLAEVTTNTIQLAKADLSQKNGLVFDYVAIDTGSTFTNFTFQGDTTYYISGGVYIYGETIIEGGTVIKFSDDGNGSLNLNYMNPPTAFFPTKTVYETESYRPAVFTSMDDNNVGETITDSSGNPSVNGDTYICVNFPSSDGLSGAIDMHNARFLYAGCAVYALAANYGQPDVASDCQFIDCSCAINSESPLIICQNDLFSDCFNPINQQGGGDVQLNNVTVDRSWQLLNDGVFAEDATVELTNSILSSVTNMIKMDGYDGYSYDAPTTLQNSLIAGIMTSNAIIVSNSSYEIPGPTNLFQTVGGGNYYLTNGSPFRGQGTANIDPNLLADIAYKTTWPPVVYMQTNISSLGTLSPVVPRDTNSSPDLGYHYDSLDYVFGGCYSDGNLAFTSGTAIGWFQQYLSPYPNLPFGILPVGNISFNGSATQPCYFARYTTVQEGGNTNWLSSIYAGAIMFDNDYGAAHLTANFTKWTDDTVGNFFTDFIGSGTGSLANCEFYGGDIVIIGMQSMFFTNCLFFRDYVSFDGSYYDLTFTFENCTFYNGGLRMARFGQDPSFWQIENCSFDGTAFWCGDVYNGTNNTLFHFNAYNTNNFNWQTYPLNTGKMPTATAWSITVKYLG